MYTFLAILWTFCAVLAFYVLATGGSPIWIFSGACFILCAIINASLAAGNRR